MLTGKKNNDIIIVIYKVALNTHLMSTCLQVALNSYLVVLVHLTTSQDITEKQGR